MRSPRGRSPQKTMKLKEAYHSIRRRLAEVSDEAGTEASLLFFSLAGVTRAELMTSEKDIDAGALEALESAVNRRLSHEPLQYILGSWGFMGLEFKVAPCALIPRQDTETLCEEALRLINERGYKTLLDICTGTGCIAISLAKLTGIKAEASDISPECAALAGENARKNGVELISREADLFSGAGSYDIITANPPYISGADMAALQDEVLFEPGLALFGGTDGLEIYRRIAASAAEHVNPGGALVMEVGLGQAEAVAELFPGREARIINDLCGIPRVVEMDF